jgi:hypothetical protein
MGHQLDPATLLLYAATLYAHTPQAWLLTIGGMDFTHGQGFSPQLEELLADVSRIGEQVLESIQECVPCMS